MKHFLLSVILIFLALFSFSQKEANTWYFGNDAGVNFNSGSPVALSNGVLTTNEGCASIADKTTGQSLFYTDGTTIWNRNNVAMTNGTGLEGNYSSTQSAVIVPQPGSSTLFYVFTTDAQDGLYTGNNGNFCYNVVDISQSGGLGSVTIKNQLLMSNMTEKIAAVRACNGLDIWVIAHQWNSNAFYAYLLTSSGVSAPVITNIGIVHKDVGSGNNAEAIGYMKCSPDGTKLVVACYEQLNTVQVFDFNNSTGVLTNPVTDANFGSLSLGAGLYGATFSPDNSRLYVSVYPSKIYQYNMLAGSGAAIVASRTLIDSGGTGSFGALQIGPDGKIYVSPGGISYLHAINNPNALGLACNFTFNAVALANGTTAALGLPDMVESFLIPPYTAILTYSGCGGNSTVSFTDSTMNGTINCLWDFGDPGSGSADSSTLQNPTHTFSSSGSFIVTLQFINACGTNTFTKTVNVSGSGGAIATPQDTSFCSGNFVQLEASGGTTYSWSPATGLSDPNIANPVAYPSVSTSYTVTVSPISCGDSTAIVNITVYQAPPTPDITQSNDTLFCGTDPTYTSYQWYYNDTLIVGATNTYFVENNDGNYNVAVTNENGCLISVGIIILGVQSPSLADGLPFTISPNPVSKELIIKNGQLRVEVIEIYNMLGEKIYSCHPVTMNSAQTVVDVSVLSAGVYFVQLSSERGKMTGKFVKE